MKKKKTIQRLLSDLDAWVNRPRNREVLSEGAALSLQNYLGGMSPSPVASLSNLAAWLGQSGSHQVLHDDLSGWNPLATSLHYLAWNERTLLAMLENGTAKSIQAFRSTFVILHAISAGEDEMAIWFANRLIAALQKKDKRVTGLTTIPLCPFTLHLFAKWRRIPLEYPPSTPCPMAIYRDLLDAWNSQEAFSKSLVAASTYHLEQAFDDSEDDTQDFCSPLYNLFPVEILAIKRVREEQRLPMPGIDHPLMQTKLAKPPDSSPAVEDDLLKAVSGKVCKEFSITAPWK